MGEAVKTEDFCREIELLIARDLRSINLSLFSSERRDTGVACFYTNKLHFVAITHDMRNGVNCYITTSSGKEDLDYRKWPTLWEALHMTPDHNCDDDLYDFIKMFPTQYEEKIKFVGASLRRYLSSGALLN